MSVDVIKDYLVALGFDVDDAGKNKFDSVLKGVTANVLKVSAAVEGAAASVLLFTTQIANGLDKLYWASQRTGASVQGIKALGYAASQTGASAESAISSLEGLAGFMRNNPGAEGFLNRLGVETRDASGKMRDTASVFTSIGQKLSNMPYYRARQYAQMLGIDENTLMAMRRGINGFAADYQSMLQKTGFNADKAAGQSNKFMTSMRGMTSLFGIMRDKIGANLAGGLAGSIDSLRQRILDNFPKIEDTLTRLIKGVLWLSETFARMIYRVIQGTSQLIGWWSRLDDGSKQLLEILGGILVVWRLLNTAFLSTPIGMLTTLILTIGLLYDDYMTWKEGGKSLIDWKKWESEINMAMKAFRQIRDWFMKLKGDVQDWQGMLTAIATYIAGGWIGKILSAHGKLMGLPVPPWLKLWAAYASYIIDDRKNIKAASESSWSYAKGNIGDAMRWLGIDTDFGRKNSIMGTPDVAYDIPGNFPDQRAQAVKRPQTSVQVPDNADTISKLIHNYAKKSGQENNQALLASLVRATGIGVDSKLLASDMRDVLKVLRDISQNISQPGSASAAEIINSPQIIAAEQPVKRPQASAQGKMLLDWMTPMFNQLESLYRLPEGLLKSVAITESGGNQFAMSGAGAKGLFQFMDGTAKDMGLRGNDVFDPTKSAQAAAKYLSQLLQQNGGDLNKTLASYNWGIGNVQRYGMDLMPQETRNYIPKVMSNMPAAAPSIQQETTINIHGVSDPREAARLTVDRQRGVNSQLTQQIPMVPR